MTEEPRWLEALAGGERERALAWIAETQAEGVIVRDAAGRVLDVNRAACEMVGVARDAYLGAGFDSAIWRSLRTPEGQPLDQRAMPSGSADPSRAEVRDLLVVISPDGGPPRTVRVNSKALWNDGRHALTVTTFVDVTDEQEARRRAEESLRLTEQITESNGAYLFTARIGEPPIRVVYASPGIDRLLGRPFPRDEPPEQTWYAAMDDEERRQAGATIRAANVGDQVRLEFRLRRPDGGVRWIRGQALRRDEPDGPYLDGVLRDVTHERRLEREHAAIGAVATAIATGEALDAVFGAAARQTAQLLDADAGGVVTRGGELPTLTGSWHAPDRQAPLQAASAAVVAAPDGTLRIAEGSLPEGTVGIVAPIRVEGEPWGALLALRAGPAFDAEEAGALTRLADLVGTAVRVARAREALVRRATSDPLTGLLNHRAFHEQLRAEVARAQRYDRHVALVLLDLDEFKGVNDREGHQRGDDLLRSVATTLHGLIRGSEVVGRLGGDEFAVLMPETALEGAAATAERMRQAIERLPLAAANGVSASAGVAELGQAESADELVRLADRALYWSKLRGRNRVTIYSPDEVRELSAQERADQLARGHVLGAVRVLARVVDLKDASTSRHSERVADLAVLLAAELGWDAERCARMRDAALVHDVGKLALPAELVARAPTPTDENALAAVEAHPVISAEIAAEALDAEQVRWIREHHERPDGTGYPAGLVGDQISDGGRILAFANSWDVMTSDRPGQPATAAEAACDVCRSQAGRAFDAEVCSAFLALWEGGRIDR